MKKFTRDLAVTVGVVGLLVAPAFAGVTGTEGGTTTITTNETNTYTNRTVSSNNQYLQNIINDRGNRTVAWNYQSQWSYQYYPVNGRTHGYANWTTHDGSTSWYSFLRVSTELASDVKVSEYYTQVGTTYNKTESDKTVQSSANLIVVGDSDYLESQFTAQGTRDVTIDIEHFYWNDLNRTDVRQKTFNRYNDYQYNQVDYYTSHTQYVSYVSPIVLDMKGDGQLMASRGNHLPHAEFMTDRLAIFDFYGSGDPVLMEWVGPQDGLLCAPKANGQVDGTSLFGVSNGFEDGYEELQVTRDKNRDGKVSGEELQGLYVWQDANGNAIAEKGELQSVQDLGITEISVNHKNYKSTFVRNGQQQASWDWWPSVKGLRKMTPPKQS